MKKLSKFDEECFNVAINIARKTYEAGNYPVGAVLTIDNKIVDMAGNEINKQKSFVNHAENSLIIRNGQLLCEAYNKGQIISLYSTLEPCIQCLGASVTNHINRVLFIQCDPNGGACNLSHDNIGLYYKEVWPEIEHRPYTDEPKKLMLKFFNEEIKKGNTKWCKKMLQLLNAN